MKSRKINLLLIFVLASCVGCRSQKIVSKPLPNNPTSYVFNVKIEGIGKLFEHYCYSKNYDSTFHLNNVYYYGTWKRSSWEEAAKIALAGDTHKNDVYMELIEGASDIYFNKKGRPLKYVMECLAHFTAIDSNTTKMEIKVLNAKVHLRDRFLPSSPHFVNNPVYKAVQPTTIEEYKILQCFGKGLGVINQMPALKL